MLAPPTPLPEPAIGYAVPRSRIISQLAPQSRRSKLATCLNRDWLVVLFLAFAAIIVHAPALQGQRIWDDDYLARDNPFIKSPLLIFEAFRHYLFLDSFSVHYRPVQNISFILDYLFWNTDTYGFHLTNVLLHAASGVLLYFLLRQLLASLLLRQVSIAARGRTLRRLPWMSVAAFSGALIWVVHPAHSAAVDYISGRADSLAFLFASAGWLLFLRAQRATRPRVRYWVYFISAASGLLALFSREIACVWMGLFLAHALLVEKSLRPRTRIGTLLCCALMIVTYFVSRQLPERRANHPSDDVIYAGPVRTTLMARALGDYVRILIFPGNLHMERTVFDPNTYRSPGDWRTGIGIEYLSILGLSALAGLVFGSAWQGRGRLVRIFGASWFLAAYLPVSNIFPLNATVAEHWLYLPSVGFIIFLAGCAVELPSRYWKLNVALALLCVGGLSVRSYLRSTDWVTAETFYRRTIAQGGVSPRTGVNLGQIYAERRNYAEAEKILRKVLVIAPDYPLAQSNLASALSHQGKIKEAEALFANVAKMSVETRKEYPRTWIGALNLATMRHGAHDDDSALTILKGARKDYPDVWALISLESEIMRESQGPDAALRIMKDFAAKNWWHHGAALALGRLYAQRGDVDAAEAQLRRASWLDLHDAEALRLIAQMRLRQNRLDEAFRAQRRAVARQPDEPRQYLLLSTILERLGRDDEARAALAQVSRLQALVKSQVAAN